MARQRLRRAIGEAQRGEVVQVTRHRAWDRLTGVVLEQGNKWVLMALDQDAGLNGYCAFRLDDVRRVKVPPSAGFLRSAYMAERTWPPPPLPGVELDSTRGLLRSLSTSSPLVTVHYEHQHPDECLIGRPIHLRRRSFVLQNIDARAVWNGNDTGFRYREVTRFEVGGAYEQRLLTVGGPAPDPA